MTIKPYYLVPLLVEQPTWGGNYIAEFKNITEPEVATQKIGQAFELFDGSMLTDQTNADGELPYAVAPATDLAATTLYHQTASLFSLQSLIDQSPEEVLGNRVASKTGPIMKTLIKFTQAKNNSYQVHVQPGQEFGHWVPKPESWYYFEDGLVTLGLRPGSSVEKYQARCQAIDNFAHQLSDQVKNQELSVDQARRELKNFIDQDHPNRFVNTVKVKKDQIVDLSECGIHHSWETNAELPQGNIVYEVQVDVKDENCTLRSFDQGNIKDDGKVRPLAIDDYFTALNSDPSFNQVDRFFKTAESKTEGNAQITDLFNNQFYTTKLLSFSGEYQGNASHTNGSFHHLFAKTGQANVKVNNQSYSLPKGWSLFIPAVVQQYMITTSVPTEVLITSA